MSEGRMLVISQAYSFLGYMKNQRASTISAEIMTVHELATYENERHDSLSSDAHTRPSGISNWQILAL
jgi:hypothetical protein